MPCNAKNPVEFDLLADLVREYHDMEVKYRRIEEKRDYLNKSIKQIMRNRALDKYVVDDLKATLKTQSRRSLNKDLAIAKLREAGFGEDEIQTCFESKEIDILSVICLHD